MPAQLIDGKKLSETIQGNLEAEIKSLKDKGLTPGLATVLVGSDPASQVYVRSKRQTCARLGIMSFHHDLPDSSTEADLLSLIRRLNQDPAVHGILVQLPLPALISSDKVLETVDPRKDVDGFHPANLGKLFTGHPTVIPCTPFGVIKLLESIAFSFKGKKAVVVGRSNIVGKPVAALLTQRDATVTLCHSKTENLSKEIGRADLVVAAIGRPELIKASWIKPGAVVIDVGMNRDAEGKLVGDVERGAVERASALTPVPGGVGPMTIAMLMHNTVAAAKRSVA